MGVNEGEAGLDALLSLGYRVEIGESGMITATLGDEVIHGQTTANAIEWRNPSSMYRVRERAYILLLRERIQQAQVAARRSASQRQDRGARPAAGGWILGESYWGWASWSAGRAHAKEMSCAIHTPPGCTPVAGATWANPADIAGAAGRTPAAASTRPCLWATGAQAHNGESSRPHR